MRHWQRNWMVITAIVVHSIWGILLLFSSAPLHTTPLAESPSSNRFLASFIYLGSSLLASLSFVFRRLETNILGLLMVIPQQYLLMLSAFTGVLCGIRGQYPDGYVPAGGALFIWSDQAWAIVGMFAHTLSLLDWYWFSTEKRFPCKDCPGKDLFKNIKGIP